MANIVTATASLGVSVAEADRLGTKVSGWLALMLHSSNEPGELSSRSGSAMITAPLTFSLSIISTCTCRVCYWHGGL